MPIFTVGPNSTFSSIANALVAASAGDTIQLESGYGGETATITLNGITVVGDATSTGIVLQLGVGVTNFTDATNGNTSIIGSGGDNVITVSGGVDAVDGGLGVDRLVVDYGAATGAVTGNSTSNFTEAGGGGRMVTITNGTFENFTINTGAAADTLTTGAGDDIFNVGDGANTVTAGQGANRITGGNNADTFTALDGGNYMDGGNGTNTLTSGGGNDTILSGTGADSIVSGGGNDVITARGGADNVDAGAGIDRLIVDYSALTTNVSGGVTAGNLGAGYTGHLADTAGNSVDFAGVEHLTITSGSGNDLITTGAGDDSLTGGAGNDTLDGGSGTADVAIYSGAVSAYTITYNTGTQAFTLVDGRNGSPDGTDVVTGVETFTFAGSSYSAVQLRNQAPVITSNGSGPTATISVAENGSAVTTVTATDADIGSTLTYSIAGGADAARFSVNGVTGALVFVTAPDFEVPTDAGANNSYEVIVQVSDGTSVDVQSLTVLVTDVAEGGAPGGGTTPSGGGATSGPDLLTGSGGADTISGDLGNDTIDGGGGSDQIYGNQGDDNVVGSSGSDTVFGGQGNDTVDYSTFAGPSLIYGNLGDDLLTGSVGRDTLLGGQGNDRMNGREGNDLIYGNLGNDSITGTGGLDTVFGGQGGDLVDYTGSADGTLIYGNLQNDSLIGGAAADTIFGGQGDDSLTGGGAADLLFGNLGNDVLTGGTGADRFTFALLSGTDTVTDFNNGEGDRMDLQGQGYSLTDDGRGGTFMTLTGGGTVNLVGVAASSVNSSFFA